MLPDALFWNVHMYGVMIAIGILLCFGVLYLYGKRLAVNPKLLDFAFYNGIASIVIGFGVAALFQAFYNYLEHPERGFRIGNGITFIGGMLGGAGFFLLVYFFFRRKSDLRLTEVLPIIPCCILIAHSLGRVGCFFAGCCYGKETDSIWGVQFPRLSHKVYPTQLYEAIFLLLLFLVCSYLLLKYRYRLTLSLYMFCYGIFRFLLEFLRGDDRGAFLGVLSPSQFWSVVIVLGSVPVYFLLKHLYAKIDAEKAAKSPVTAEPDNKAV